MGLALETLGVDLINVLGTGGSRCKPTALRHNFQAADWGIVARGFGQLGGDWLSRQVRLLYRVRGEFFQPCFLLGRGRRVDARVVRDAELRRQFAVMFSGILASARGNLRSQQVHDWPVLVGRPYCAVKAKKTRPSAFFSAETIRAIDQARHKPLETHWHFAELAAELFDDPVYHTAAHQSLSHRNCVTPLGPAREQIANGNGKVMIRVHQTRNRSYDPVPLRVGIVPESHVE